MQLSLLITFVLSLAVIVLFHVPTVSAVRAHTVKKAAEKIAERVWKEWKEAVKETSSVLQQPTKPAEVSAVRAKPAEVSAVRAHTVKAVTTVSAVQPAPTKEWEMAVTPAIQGAAAQAAAALDDALDDEIQKLLAQPTPAIQKTLKQAAEALTAALKETAADTTRGTTGKLLTEEAKKKFKAAVEKAADTLVKEVMQTAFKAVEEAVGKKVAERLWKELLAEAEQALEPQGANR
eukprot:GHVS01066130.1.p1 GENE.GHVS01066130.1~~GHVS01066130.1.p1  ORF type:complete len:234 (+),score=55.74 GHVS01066130.1:61-762(+)